MMKLVHATDAEQAIDVPMKCSKCCSPLPTAKTYCKPEAHQQLCIAPQHPPHALHNMPRHRNMATSPRAHPPEHSNNSRAAPNGPAPATQQHPNKLAAHRQSNTPTLHAPSQQPVETQRLQYRNIPACASQRHPRITAGNACSTATSLPAHHNNNLA